MHSLGPVEGEKTLLLSVFLNLGQAVVDKDKHSLQEA